MRLQSANVCIVLLVGVAGPVLGQAGPALSQKAIRANSLDQTETIRVSVASGGAQGVGHRPSISFDGRCVAFKGLIPGLGGGVFVRDRVSGTTELMSVDSNGTPANGASCSLFFASPSISADGYHVAFDSVATNLVPGDTADRQDIFVHDRQSGITERVSVSSAGAQGNDHSYDPSISSDGRYVAFLSRSTNLVPGDTNGWADTFVRDRLSGTTERVSVSSAEAQGNMGGGAPSITPDGRYVAFLSGSTNLVPGGLSGIFVRDRLNGTTERVSLDGLVFFGDEGRLLSISSDGRYVALANHAESLVPGDTNFSGDIFVHDRLSGTTERVSVDSAEAQSNSGSYDPSISADGRYVAFSSLASNLVPGDTNGWLDVFVRDRQRGTTTRVSVDSARAQGNQESYSPSISADGRHVAFESFADNLVPWDTNGNWDCFLRFWRDR